jgi:hypothetical protein
MNTSILTSLLGLALCGAGCSTQNNPNTGPASIDITSVGGGTQSQLQPSHWPYDKYANMPEITPKSKTTLLDADGPGVVTLIHVSKYNGGDQGKLIIRVWYDDQKTPAIEMPWNGQNQLRNFLPLGPQLPGGVLLCHFKESCPQKERQGFLCYAVPERRVLLQHETIELKPE